MSGCLGGACPVPGGSARSDGSGESTPWTKQFVALTVSIFFILSAILLSLVPTASAGGTDRAGEDLTGHALNGSTIKVKNVGSSTAVIDAYTKKERGNLSYTDTFKVKDRGDVDVDELTLIPGESAEIKVNGLAGGVAVLSKRGYLYPMDTSTVIKGETEPGAPVTATVASDPKIYTVRADSEGHFEFRIPAANLEDGGTHHFKIIAGDIAAVDPAKGKKGKADGDSEGGGWKGYVEEAYPREGNVEVVGQEIGEGRTLDVGTIDLIFNPLDKDVSVKNARAAFEDEWTPPTRKIVEKAGEKIYRWSRKKEFKFKDWKEDGRAEISYVRKNNFEGSVDIELGDHPGLMNLAKSKIGQEFTVEAVPSSFGVPGSLELFLLANGQRVEEISKKIEGDDFPGSEEDTWSGWFEASVGDLSKTAGRHRVEMPDEIRTELDEDSGRYVNKRFSVTKYELDSWGTLEVPVTVRGRKEFHGLLEIVPSVSDDRVEVWSEDSTVNVPKGESRTVNIKIRPKEKGLELEEPITVEVKHAGGLERSVVSSIDLDVPGTPTEKTLAEKWEAWFTVSTSGHKFSGGWDKDVSGHRTEAEKKDGKYFKEKFEEYTYSLQDWQTASIPISLEGHNFDGRVELSVDPDSGLDVSLSDSVLDVHSKVSTTMSVTPTVSPSDGTTLMKNVDVYARDANPPGDAEAIDRKKVADIRITIPSKGSESEKIDEWKTWFELEGKGYISKRGDWHLQSTGEEIYKQFESWGREKFPADKYEEAADLASSKEGGKWKGDERYSHVDFYTEEQKAVFGTEQGAKAQLRNEKGIIDSVVNGLSSWITGDKEFSEGAIKEITGKDIRVTWTEEKTKFYENKSGIPSDRTCGMYGCYDPTPKKSNIEIEKKIPEYKYIVSYFKHGSGTFDTEYEAVDAATKGDRQKISVEPVEWSAGWYEKDWHFKDYASESKAEEKFEEFKDDYFKKEVDKYPTKYKAEWYALNSHSSTFDTKSEAEDAEEAAGYFPYAPTRYNEEIKRTPGSYEYKAEWTTWEDRSSRQYDDWSDADRRRDSLQSKNGTKDVSIEWNWTDYDEYVTETHREWFDDKSDHDGEVVDKKCVNRNSYCSDTDYKIRWTTTEHHRTWISGYWTGCYKTKQMRYWDSTCHKHTYWTGCYKTDCDWNWSWWRGWYRTCNRYWDSTCHKHSYWTGCYKHRNKRYWDSTCDWHPGHWNEWTTTEAHEQWFDHSWDHSGSVVDTKCVERSSYCADHDYKIEWTESHWEGGYDYTVEWKGEEHHSKWFDSYGEAFARNDPSDLYIESRVSDYDYKYKWDTRDYGSETFWFKSDAEDAATKNDRHKVSVEPTEWQVEYYKKKWKSKSGFESETAAKNAYQGDITKHGGYTYATKYEAKWKKKVTDKYDSKAFADMRATNLGVYGYISDVTQSKEKVDTDYKVTFEKTHTKDFEGDLVQKTKNDRLPAFCPAPESKVTAVKTDFLSGDATEFADEKKNADMKVVKDYSETWYMVHKDTVQKIRVKYPKYTRKKKITRDYEYRRPTFYISPEVKGRSSSPDESFEGVVSVTGSANYFDVGRFSPRYYSMSGNIFKFTPKYDWMEGDYSVELHGKDIAPPEGIDDGIERGKSFNLSVEKPDKPDTVTWKDADGPKNGWDIQIKDRITFGAAGTYRGKINDLAIEITGSGSPDEIYVKNNKKTTKKTWGCVAGHCLYWAKGEVYAQALPIGDPDHIHIEAVKAAKLGGMVSFAPSSFTHEFTVVAKGDGITRTETFVVKQEGW